MKLLLDECVTRYVIADLAEHDVYTVDRAGLRGLKNGELLRAASGSFDVLVTVDKNLAYQQNIKSLDIAVLVLAAKGNDYNSLRPLMPRARRALEEMKPGETVRVEAEGGGDRP